MPVPTTEQALLGHRSSTCPMASSSSSSPDCAFLLARIVLVFFALVSAASSPGQALSYDYPPLVGGLSFTFYQSTCPNVETVVKNYLKNAFKKDIGLAAGLLRVHFHDCFVQGCDGSVLLDGPGGSPSEKQAPPNLSLRPAAFQAINDLRVLIDKTCPRVVSCADIAALAARDSVAMSGGPNYKVPLGRRDGVTFASRDATLASLPAPSSHVTELLRVFSNIKLDVTDLVTLSGGHTIGVAHCTSFTDRLYPTQDPIMNKSFANLLKGTCPTTATTNTTANDIRTPNVFDNKYYVDLMNREGLFTSDQDLYTDARTKDIVKNFAVNQSLYFNKFAYSMVKMGQLGVITGHQGQIRANCAATNPSLTAAEEDLLRTVVGKEEHSHQKSVF